MSRSLEMAVFVAVVDAGSFVGAAEASNMSKAAVSRHVSALEARLGVRLLQRTTRRLSLTEEGQIFYQRAREVLNAMDEAESTVSARALEPGGKIRINVPVSYGIARLAPLWMGFMARHPKVKLDIALNDRVVDLIEEGYDMAVRISSLPSSSLVSRRLTKIRMMLCASPDYLRRRGTPTTPEDLLGHDLLAYELLASRDEWLFHGPSGHVRVRIQPKVSSNNGDTCRMIALQGGGITLQPDFTLGADVLRGDLVELLPGFRAEELGVYAVFPSRHQLSLKVRHMVDYLTEALGGKGRGSVW